MKLTLKIKLLPSTEQAVLLLETIKEANAVCNTISDVAWEKRIFNNIKLHHACYHVCRQQSVLSSQMLVRSIAKVSLSYMVNKSVKHAFNPLGGITYDDRIMTYKPNNMVSLWCLGGRQKMSFVCHNPKYLPYIKGEADLVYKNGKFYLFQTVDISEDTIEDVEEFIGVDFGLTDIAVTSDGIKHSADGLNAYREHRQAVRSSIQAKAATSKRSTKRNCRKLAKRLNGKETTHSSIINHTIAKSIVLSAKEAGKGVAIENLTNIRNTSKRRNKKFRTKLGRWTFGQLRYFLEYKGLLYGVPVVVVDPRYTSQTCSVCKHIGKRTNKHFKCNNCGSDIDADVNASINIAALGAAINQPEKSTMYCSLHSLSGLKPIRSLVGG